MDNTDLLSFNGIDIHPIKLKGNWEIGYALDLHTTRSIPLGEDQFGHMQFDNIRPPIAELLYKYKYRYKKDKLDIIGSVVTEAIITLILTMTEKLDCIIPVPASNQDRSYQPVLSIAKNVSTKLGIPCYLDLLLKTKDTNQIKNASYSEKIALLNGAFSLGNTNRKLKNILLVDDLYKSGATANACVQTLKKISDDVKIYLLTITKTRT